MKREDTGQVVSVARIAEISGGDLMGTYETIGGWPADDPEFNRDPFEPCYDLLATWGYLAVDPEDFEDCDGCPVEHNCAMLERYLAEQYDMENPTGKEDSLWAEVI